MAKNEEVLEELYTLLELYFEINIPSCLDRLDCKGSKDVEPQLDRMIFKEKILARITGLIIENYIL